MPKLKTNSGTKKRFKCTAGLLKRRKAFRNHILTKKSTKSKRHKRSPSSVHARDLLAIRRLLALC